MPINQKLNRRQSDKVRIPLIKSQHYYHAHFDSLIFPLFYICAHLLAYLCVRLIGFEVLIKMVCGERPVASFCPYLIFV